MNIMARRSLTSMIFTVLCIIASLLISQASAGGEVAAAAVDVGWAMPMMRPGCKGTIAECLVNTDEEEFELDSESNRRILATRRYVSYGALQKNRVPCSRRGSSYYNCRPGFQANPYTRGCSAITRCRS